MNNYRLIKNVEWSTVEINREIAEIPRDWNISKLNNLVKSSITKGTTPTTIGFPFLEVGDINFFKVENMKEGKLLPASIFINKECNEKMKRSQLEEGDLLFSIAGTIGNLAKIGREDLPANINQAIAIIRFKNVEEVDFAKYYIKFCIEKIKKNTLNGVIPNFNLEMLKNLEVVSPNNDNKVNVSEILSTQESVIEDVKSLIEQNERRLNYLSSELLSGRIRVKEENGETIFYKNPEENWKTVEMNGEDVEIPSDWLIEKNENLFRENPKSKIQAKKVGLDGTNPAFNCSPEQKYWSEEVIVLGENLFLSTGGSAAVHYYNGDAAYTTDVYSIKAKNIDPKLLFYILRDNLSALNSIFYGAGLKHLNKKEFKDLKFCIPCSNESKLIVEVLNLQEDYIKDLKRLLALEEKRFQWLLDNLMSGKYIVTKEED